MAHFQLDHIERKSKTPISNFRKCFLNELRLLFFRTYLIKQTRTYVEEHFGTESDFIVEIDNFIDDIVHCSIQGRHPNANGYKAWIHYLPADNRIRPWYWQCKMGGRIVERYTHIANIIWYSLLYPLDRFY